MGKWVCDNNFPPNYPLTLCGNANWLGLQFWCKMFSFRTLDAFAIQQGDPMLLQPFGSDVADLLLEFVHQPLSTNDHSHLLSWEGFCCSCGGLNAHWASTHHDDVVSYLHSCVAAAKGGLAGCFGTAGCGRGLPGAVRGASGDDGVIEIDALTVGKGAVALGAVVNGGDGSDQAGDDGGSERCVGGQGHQRGGRVLCAEHAVHALGHKVEEVLGLDYLDVERVLELTASARSSQDSSVAGQNMSKRGPKELV